MDMESDRFMNLKYSEEDFKTESGAILGEYNKSSSNPFQTIDERVREEAFQVHTYKHTTIGFLKDIQDMPNQYKYSLEFFNRWYRPENCVVVVVGDFKQDRLVELAKKYYSSWKRGAYNVEIPAEPPQQAPKHIDQPWKAKTLPIFTAAFHGPAFGTGSIDFAAMNVLSQLVFSQTSDLYKKLVIDDQLVEFVEGSMDFRRDPSLFYVFTRIKDEANIAKVSDAIMAAIEDAKAKPVSAERLASVKAHMKYEFAMGLDNADHIANMMATYIELTNDPESVNAFYALYDKVTADDITSVAKKYFTENNKTTLVLKNQAQEVKQ
jgi:zinc protease